MKENENNNSYSNSTKKENEKNNSNLNSTEKMNEKNNNNNNNTNSTEKTNNKTNATEKNQTKSDRKLNAMNDFNRNDQSSDLNENNSYQTLLIKSLIGLCITVTFAYFLLKKKKNLLKMIKDSNIFKRNIITPVIFLFFRLFLNSF